MNDAGLKEWHKRFKSDNDNTNRDFLVGWLIVTILLFVVFFFVNQAITQ